MSSMNTIRKFDEVRIAFQPYDFATLLNATWHPYPLGKEHYNESGNNGYLEGVVKEGYTVNRLLGVTRRDEWKSGEVRRFEFTPITALRETPGVPTFTTAHCG